MKRKILFLDVISILVVLFLFHGVNYIAFLILPKWVDVIIGFPLSIYLIYKWLIIYADFIKTN